MHLFNGEIYPFFNLFNLFFGRSISNSTPPAIPSFIPCIACVCVMSSQSGEPTILYRGGNCPLAPVLLLRLPCAVCRELEKLDISTASGEALGTKLEILCRG